jgi:pimeloyl-ACP methyl ester carboxylesterase
MPYLDSGGVQIYYETLGQGVPALMINGYGPPCQWVSRFYMPHFADRFRCATYDLRGIGRSGEPAEAREYDLDRLAADGMAVMDAMGWETAHVWGASLGARIALAIALLAPHRVRSLVLNSVDTGAPNLAQKKYAAIFKTRMQYRALAGLHGTDPERVARETATYFYAPDEVEAHADTIAWYAEAVRAYPIRRPWPPFAEAFRRIGDLDAYVASLPDHAEPQAGTWFSLFDQVHQVKAKTLVLQGYEDPIIAVDSAVFAFEQLENAEIRIYKRMKHSFSSRPDVLRETADWMWAREGEGGRRTAT